MAILIALGIALAAVAFVAAPLFLGGGRTPRSRDAETSDSLEMQDLVAEKETMYAAIQELDFDFKSGKLSEEDHQSLRQRYEARAATLLQAIDALRAGGEKPGARRKSRRETRQR